MSWLPKSPSEGNYKLKNLIFKIAIKNISFKIGRFHLFHRQQNSESGKGDGVLKQNQQSKVTKSAEAILAQKKLYQKHLRTLQQSSLARDVLQSKTRRQICACII